MPPGRVKTALANRAIPATRAASAVGRDRRRGRPGRPRSAWCSRPAAERPTPGQPSAAPPARPPPPGCRPVRRGRPGSRRRSPGQAVPDSTELATVPPTAPRYASPGRLATGDRPGQLVRAAVGAAGHRRPGPAGSRCRLAQRPGRVHRLAARGRRQRSARTPVPDRRRPRHHQAVAVRPRTAGLLGPGRRRDHRTTRRRPASTSWRSTSRRRSPTPATARSSSSPPTTRQAISDWEGSGDAVIGIHGPLGEDSEIGTIGGEDLARLHPPARPGTRTADQGPAREPRSTSSARRAVRR